MNYKEGGRFTESSPILPTRYAYDAANLIRNLSTNFKIIIIVVSFLSLFAIANILHEMGARIIYLDEIFDKGMAIISISILILAIYLFNSLSRTKTMLSRWADLFEQNSIRTGITISLEKRSKEEVVKSVAQTIQELGEALRDYISSEPNLSKFINVHRGKELDFDVLIDKDTPGISSDLKNILSKYGAVIAKVADGIVDERLIASFANILSDYTRQSKNAVGVAIIVGEKISDQAYNYVARSNHEIERHFVLVEKPSVTTNVVT